MLHNVTGWWFGTGILFFHIGNNHPNWLSCFSEGLKPPTRSTIIYYVVFHFPQNSPSMFDHAPAQTALRMSHNPTAAEAASLSLVTKVATRCTGTLAFHPEVTTVGWSWLRFDDRFKVFFCGFSHDFPINSLGLGNLFSLVFLGPS